MLPNVEMVFREKNENSGQAPTHYLSQVLLLTKLENDTPEIRKDAAVIRAASHFRPQLAPWDRRCCHKMRMVFSVMFQTCIRSVKVSMAIRLWALVCTRF